MNSPEQSKPCKGKLPIFFRWERCIKGRRRFIRYETCRMKTLLLCRLVNPLNNRKHLIHSTSYEDAARIGELQPVAACPLLEKNAWLCFLCLSYHVSSSKRDFTLVGLQQRRDARLMCVRRRCWELNAQSREIYYRRDFGNEYG